MRGVGAELDVGAPAAEPGPQRDQPVVGTVPGAGRAERGDFETCFASGDGGWNCGAQQGELKMGGAWRGIAALD